MKIKDCIPAGRAIEQSGQKLEALMDELDDPGMTDEAKGAQMWRVCRKVYEDLESFRVPE